MRILLIAYHFPPDPAVGALRSGRVARLLAERGHRVHVLAGPSGAWAGSWQQDGVVVERLQPWFDPRGTYARSRKWTRRQRQGAPVHGPPGRASAYTTPETTSFLKRQLVALLWLPDDRQGWMAAVIRRARQLAHHQFDLIYTTAPPFSAHLAGLGLRRKFRRSRWLVEFRDPWTDNPAKPRSGRTRWSDAAERGLEKACLNRADHVISVTESAAVLLRERLGGAGGKVDVIRNGIEGPIKTPRDSQPGNGRILYAGNLYHSRDPLPFLHGLASLDSSGDLPPGAGVDFVGDCNSYRGIDIRSFAAEIGIAHRVNVEPPVPHHVSIERMRHASVLLLLAQNQPLQVPNKLYEYLGAARPILAFADRGGETAWMLEQIGGHIVLDSGEPVAIQESIRAALSTNVAPDEKADELLKAWNTHRQLAHLARIIEGRALWPVG